MRPRLIAALIRHGEYDQLPDTPSAHQPFALVAEGRAQALAAAEQLHHVIASERWTLLASIDSSSLLRSWQTARLISDRMKALGLPDSEVESFDALAERGVGSAANLSVAKIEELIHQDPRYPDAPPDWKANSHYRLPFPGAESLLEAGERVAAHMTRRMRELQHSALTSSLKLFVGHGAAFRHAAFRLGVLPFEQIARLSMYHARPVFLEYLPDGSWQHVQGEWKVRSAGSLCLD